MSLPVKSYNLIRWFLLAGILIGIGLGISLVPSPSTWHKEILRWREDLHYWGLLFLALAFIPGSLIMVPASVLFMLAGFFYDLLPALVAVSIGSALAATLLFLVGRFLARDWVAKKLSGHALFKALDHAVANHGFRIVFLTRLSPFIPFVFLNYAFSITRISLSVFLAGTWLGMVPAMLFWVYLGSTIKNLEILLAGKIEGDDLTGSWRHFLVPGVGLVITLIVAGLVTRMARQSLTQVLQEDSTGIPDSSTLTNPNHLSASINAASSSGN